MFLSPFILRNFAHLYNSIIIPLAGVHLANSSYFKCRLSITIYSAFPRIIFQFSNQFKCQSLLVLSWILFLFSYPIPVPIVRISAISFFLDTGSKLLIDFSRFGCCDFIQKNLWCAVPAAALCLKYKCLLLWKFTQGSTFILGTCLVTATEHLTKATQVPGHAVCHSRGGTAEVVGGSCPKLTVTGEH